MASGGSWTAQNKKRPGAYINFIGTPKSLSKVGERGILATPLSLSWGDEIVELTAQDLLTGASLSKAGVLFSDEEALNLRLALQSCQKLIIYRTNAGSSTKATGAYEEFLSATARFGGTLGNQIKITSEEVTGTTAPTFNIKTYVKDILKDQQRIVFSDDSVPTLQNNDFVEFGTLASKIGAFSFSLAGGTDGIEGDLGAALDALGQYKFNILAITQTENSAKQQAILWTKSQRSDVGNKIQVVVSNYDEDDEGVIVTANQRYRTSEGTEISGAQAVLAIGSLEAGATLTQSLTGAAIPDAVAILDAPIKHEDIEKGLDAGKLILSRREDGAVVVEKDQNSLHIFTPSKGYVFSKNRPLRTLDQINNDIKLLFNTSYLGKVSNNENGRNIFKGDLANYLKQLEAQEAIQNFSIDDLSVVAGDDIDSIIVNLYVQPVDSMEKLYMTVNVVS